jgi:hypothetical protein
MGEGMPKRGLNVLLHLDNAAKAVAVHWVLANASWLRHSDDLLWIIRDDEDGMGARAHAVQNLDEIRRIGAAIKCVDLGLELASDLMTHGANNDFLVANPCSVARHDWRNVIDRARNHSQLAAACGRWINAPTRGSANALLVDLNPARLADKITSWSFSEEMHGVGAAQLPTEFLWIAQGPGFLLAHSLQTKMDLARACENLFDVIVATGQGSCLYLPDIIVYNTDFNVG